MYAIGSARSEYNGWLNNSLCCVCVLSCPLDELRLRNQPNIFNNIQAKNDVVAFWKSSHETINRTERYWRDQSEKTEERFLSEISRMMDFLDESSQSMTLENWSNFETQREMWSWARAETG